ncbi:hypothetical protein CH063_01712 [Colletotrichum higginsianum]|uniref:Uncharacterized protein n=1 Tax=Colletotrichum higginsianum (strain IMI 349063) TaxID=759273 RepID=H1VBA2_COLHI|nr:hypothetical protein CH063_01712 [Colletotrichum higginsianum]
MRSSVLSWPTFDDACVDCAATGILRFGFIDQLQQAPRCRSTQYHFATREPCHLPHSWQRLSFDKLIRIIPLLDVMLA